MNIGRYVKQYLERFGHFNNENRIIDVEGIRIGNLVINFDKLEVQMYSESNGKYITQEIDPEDVMLISGALRLSRLSNE
jgi:hypothetical protein